MRLSATVLAALVALGVGGCDKKPEERAQAAGEILPGTVSDAMIATDQTRADPPLAPRAPGKGEPGKPKGAATAADETEGEPEAEASPAPETTAAPAPAAPTPAAT